MLARDPDDQVAAIGAANTLTMSKRFDEAEAAFDAILARRTDNAELFSCAAEAVVQGGKADKAAWLCEQGLKAAPRNAACLAILSIASRLMEDGRDETINGYDTLVRSFDLEPPQGFSNMADFNAELNAELDRLHPVTREFINQSLRGGTQTPDQLFGASLPMVAKLKQRIDESGGRAMPPGWARMKAIPCCRGGPTVSAMPGPGRRVSGDCGFHVNHIHPMGWISSCYYVAVPDAVQDEAGRQGWIKFGEPLLRGGAEKSGPPRHPARTGPAGAVPQLYVARHDSVPRRGGAHDHRVRCGAGLAVSKNCHGPACPSHPEQQTPIHATLDGPT